MANDFDLELDIFPYEEISPEFELEYIPDEKIPENIEFELESDLVPLKKFG